MPQAPFACPNCGGNRKVDKGNHDECFYCGTRFDKPRVASVDNSIVIGNISNSSVVAIGNGASVIVTGNNNTIRTH